MKRCNVIFYSLFVLCMLAPQMYSEESLLSDAIKNAPANTWTLLFKDGGSGCFGSGTVYMPPVNSIISWGTRVHSAKRSSFSTLHFNLEKCIFVPAYPKGKEEEWKGKFKNESGWNLGGGTSFYTRDKISLPKPVMTSEMVAWDGHKKRVIYYANITFAYYPETHSWAEIKTGPAGPPLAR